MGSHMGPKIASLVAREVALCASKGLLSAVNHHVYFQVVRPVTRVATLVAIVFFLFIGMDVVDFGHLGNL